MKNMLDYQETVPSEVECAEIDEPEDLSPLIDCNSMKDYERLHKPEDIARAVLTMENESVLIRRPFYWTKDGARIPDTNVSMKLDQVCTLYRWKIVVSFGHHFAIVAPLDAST